MAIYEMGDCKLCGKLRALKDGICAQCQNKKGNPSSKFITDFWKNNFGVDL